MTFSAIVVFSHFHIEQKLLDRLESSSTCSFAARKLHYESYVEWYLSMLREKKTVVKIKWRGKLIVTPGWRALAQKKNINNNQSSVNFVSRNSYKAESKKKTEVARYLTRLSSLYMIFARLLRVVWWRCLPQNDWFTSVFDSNFFLLFLLLLFLSWSKNKMTKKSVKNS